MQDNGSISNKYISMSFDEHIAAKTVYKIFPRKDYVDYERFKDVAYFGAKAESEDEKNYYIWLQGYGRGLVQKRKFFRISN